MRSFRGARARAGRGGWLGAAVIAGIVVGPAPAQEPTPGATPAAEVKERGGVVPIEREDMIRLVPPGDQTPAIRRPDPMEILAPPGYIVETFATRLDFPADIAFSDRGEVFIAESGPLGLGDSPVRTPPAQIIQVRPDNTKRVIYDTNVSTADVRRADSSAQMPEGLIPPITGMTWHNGKLYISHRSRISVLDLSDEDPRTRFRTIVNGLPVWGRAVNGKPIFDPKGKLVFFVPTQGNAGVIDEVGASVILSTNKLRARDIPGEDVELTGRTFRVPLETANHAGTYFAAPDERIMVEAGRYTGKVPYEHLHKLVPPEGEGRDRTGAFAPIWGGSEAGRVVKGERVCNGAFFRCDPDGKNLERIAWGFRDSGGYGFAPDGRLICTHEGIDTTAPRSAWFDTDSVYEVVAGEWYGWPDFFGGLPGDDPRFGYKGDPVEPLLTAETHRRLLGGRSRPRQPLMRLPVQSTPRGMAFGRADFGIDPGDVLVAEMGTTLPAFKGPYLVDSAFRFEEWQQILEERPAQVPPGVEWDWPGFKVQILDLDTGRAFDFLTNATRGPATAGRGTGLERPVQLEWGPDGALYVVDIGVIQPAMFQGRTVLNAHSQTGVIWRVHRGGHEGDLPGR